MALARAQLFAGSPPPGANSGRLVSTISSVAKPLEERLRTKWDFKTIALTAGAMLLASTGIGLAGSYVLDRLRNSHQAHVKKEVITDEFRNRIAAKFGIDPRKVTVRDLEQAAQSDGVLRQAKSKIDAEQSSANRAALLSNGAIFAAGGFLPGVGGVAKLAVDGGAMVTGGMVSGLFDKDVLQLTDALSHIDGKLRQGQGVTEYDLMLLRISQDDAWQKAFKKAHGYSFHKGTPEQQRIIMNNMHELPDFAEMAKGVNSRMQNGNLELADLPEMVSANSASSFAGREASRRAVAAQNSGIQAVRPAAGNYAAAIDAERSQMVTPTVQ